MSEQSLLLKENCNSRNSAKISIKTGSEMTWNVKTHREPNQQDKLLCWLELEWLEALPNQNRISEGDCVEEDSDVASG